MSEQEEKYSDNDRVFYAFTNTIVQTLAMIMYQYLSIDWPMFVVMGMLSLLGFMQTLSYAGIVSGAANFEPKKDTAASIRILVGIFYMISSYQVYQMGYVVFAGFAMAHSAIYTLAMFLKWIKQ